jgi:4-hydroxy-tetrahydrodipicolinate reductase
MKIGLMGIGGRMGAALLETLLDRNHVLSCAIEAPGSPLLGSDAGVVSGSPSPGVPVSPLSEKLLAGTEVVIDFSSPSGTMSLLPVAVALSIPLVIGTTGFDKNQVAEIEDAAQSIPVLFSPNMSVGVNLLFKLTELVSGILDEGYDVELFEAHHRFKKDAPSGTARKLIDIIKQTNPSLSSASEKHGREGLTGERSNNEIGVMTMRGGDIVGEHTVYYAGMGERIELTHKATSRNTFASGAVRGAEFVSRQKPGLYSMFDVLGI